MHETLAAFEEVWSFDFEFLGGDAGEQYDVVCLAARELRSGRTLRLWRDELETALLERLQQIARQRYGTDGYWIDPERRRIPDHWHAHARPAGGFFDPASDLYGKV